MLKVVHINKEATSREAKAKKFWEEVLKPKWEAKAKKDDIEFCRKHGIAVPEQEGTDRHA